MSATKEVRHGEAVHDVSFGTLCLLAAYQLGAERARADWDGSVPGQIVGGSGPLWYDRTGAAWDPTNPNGWTRVAQADLPVPVSEIQFLESKQDGYTGYAMLLITRADEAWYFPSTELGWRYKGEYPGGPVSLDSESLGEVKGRYR